MCRHQHPVRSSSPFDRGPTFLSMGSSREGDRNFDISLAPGSHDLQFVNPTMSTFDTTVVIESGQTTRVDKLMTPGSRR